MQRKRRPAPTARKAAIPEGRPRGRPPVISRDQLLAIARDVFLELGFRATTAEVAKRAGIAEGTLFHRFDSKEALFRAAMRFEPEDILSFIEALPARAGKQDLRVTLIEFSEGFVELARVALPVMMMSWSNPESELCGDRSVEKTQRHRRVLTAVGAFFQAEMKNGRMRPGSPEVLTRMLLGSLHQFCMGELFAGDEAGRMPASEFVHGVVDVLLAATAPSGRARKPVVGARRRKEVRS